MARTYWNSLVIVVAALGLGGGTSWFLFAQTPDAPPERYVTIDVSNEQVRCKILRSWSLPDGGRAYHVTGIESGDMLTVVRQNATAGEKDAFVRVYKWRDATTSPVGAPVPPDSASAAVPPKSATVDNKSAKAKAMPPVVLNDAKKNQSPYASNAPKAASKIVRNLPAKSAPSALAAPKETIVVVPDRPDAAAARPEGIAMSLPTALADKQTSTAPPRKDFGFDLSVDQLGQAPWAKEDAAADLPGRITLEPSLEKNEIQLAGGIESKLKTAADLQSTPKDEPKRPLTPVAPIAAADAKSELKAPAAAAPAPLPLPTLPASELPPRSFPALAESTILPPPLSPPNTNDVLPSVAPPPALTPLPEVAPLPPAKTDAVKGNVSSAPLPPPTEPEPVRVPPYDSARNSVYDRLLSASVPKHAAPVGVAAATHPTPADAASSDDRSRTTIVIGPTVIVQSSAMKSAMEEAVPAAAKERASFGHDAPVVSKITDFAAKPTPTTNVIPEPENAILPPPALPSAAVPVTFSSPPIVIAPMSPPVVVKEAEAPAANYEVADPAPAPFVYVPRPHVTKPVDVPTERSIASTTPYVPEPKYTPPLPRDGGFNRTRTTIAPGQAAIATSVPATNFAQAMYVNVADGPRVIVEPAPIVARKPSPAANRFGTIAGLMGRFREERPATPQRGLTGSLFGGGNSASKPVIGINPESNSTRETLVDANESRNAYGEPIVQKRSSASAPRPTSIVGLIGAFRAQRSSAEQTIAAPEPTVASPRSFASSGDAARPMIGSAVMAAATPTAYPSETIVEVTDGKYASASITPIVEKRPNAQLNRSATIVGLMGADRSASAQAAPGHASPYAAQRIAAAGFDRTRTTIVPDPSVAMRAAAAQATIAKEMVQTNDPKESVVIVEDTNPIVQKRSNPEIARSPIIVGTTVANPAPLMESAFPIADPAPRVQAVAPPPASYPPATTAFIGSAPARFAPPTENPGLIPPVAYDPLPAPQAMPMPSVNPIQQATHNAPGGKIAITVPANPAMDRPVAVVVNSGDQAALAKLMQTAKDSTQPSQRELAVIGLANYDGRSRPQLVSFLNQLAVNDPAPTVRASAVNALARMNVAPESVVHTLETLREDPDFRVRQAVTQATAAYGLGSR